MILSAASDITAWSLPRLSQEEEGQDSHLSSSPLVAAVKHGHLQAIELLLANGFDPSTTPVSSPWTSITPAMDLLYTPPSTLQLRILQALCESNPTSTLLTTTPIFKINALHFAAAALDTTLLIAMLEYINLSQITPTALGHTLLHLACLPLDDTFVNVFSQAIANSIHHVRTPSTDWQSEEIGFFRYVNQARENSEIANIEFSMNNRSAFFRPQSTESFSGSV